MIIIFLYFRLLLLFFFFLPRGPYSYWVLLMSQSRPFSGQKAQPLSRGRSRDSQDPVWYLFWGRWRGEGCRECVFDRVGMKVRDEMKVKFCWGMRGWKVICLIWVGRECGECGGLRWFLIYEWVGVACWGFCCEWMICSRVVFLCVWFSCCFLFVCERWTGWRKVCLGCSWCCCWMWIVFCIWGGLLVWWVGVEDEWGGRLSVWVVMREVWDGFTVGGFWSLSGGVGCWCLGCSQWLFSRLRFGFFRVFWGRWMRWWVTRWCWRTRWWEGVMFCMWWWVFLCFFPSVLMWGVLGDWVFFLL